MSQGPVKDKSYQFAVMAVRFCHRTKDYSLRPIILQFLRAATSIGANIEEASAAQSRKDFISKMCIASKEAREANYWLRLIRDSSILRDAQIGELLSLSEELVKLLTAIVKTSSRNIQISTVSSSKLKTKNSKLVIAHSEDDR